MPESGWAGLRRLFVDEYDDLRRRLAQRLGSADAAGDALQDTFLQLTREKVDAEPIRNPKHYLFRMAVNIANSQIRTERRRLTLLEATRLEEALEIPDVADGPAEIAEARSDMRRLHEILEAMPSRRRAMVLAVLVEGKTHRELAAIHALSIRMIQIEMNKAAEEIAARLSGAKIIHFASKSRVTS